ncbi:MAG: Hsp70 family protein [Desulfobacterales bacterium]|nr:Hsp70 family protein [Desulfobacterales bacterium]
MEPIVGIDLGTTNSEIAFIIDEHPEVITDNDDGIFPSCVGIGNDGKIIVGKEAKNQAIVAPDRTVLSIKRLMGTNQQITMANKNYTPQEISAIILKALKERAEKKLGKPIRKAVITVPAYFTDAQRKATREAGEIAGLNVVRIINEPTAAALAYEGLHKETQKILIYDLGGGTFDVSIVKIEDGVVEVLSSTGDNHLGGDDFDQKILDRLITYIEGELGVTVRDNPYVISRLRRTSEEAKKLLSSAPFATLEEDHIGKKKGKDVHLSYEMSRIDFENLIEDELSRTMESVTKALNDASLLPSAIDKIILVGGSTRIPKISEMLKEKIGQLPHSEIDPDLCVAIGASIQAGREMGVHTSSVLIDITPYTFGTSAIGEVNGVPVLDMFVSLINRNTKLPAKKSEVFATIFDNQKMTEVTVFQGENPHAYDNILIGKYQFDLTKAPAGSKIIIDFELDVNGILKVLAIEKHTGRRIQATIENAFSNEGAEFIDDARKRINGLWQSSFEEDEIDDASDDEVDGAGIENELPKDISELIQRAESMMDSVSPEDKDEIVNLIEDIVDAVNAGNMDEAKQHKQKLEDLLFYIE